MDPPVARLQAPTRPIVRVVRCFTVPAHSATEVTLIGAQLDPPALPSHRGATIVPTLALFPCAIGSDGGCAVRPVPWPSAPSATVRHATVTVDGKALPSAPRSPLRAGAAYTLAPLDIPHDPARRELRLVVSSESSWTSQMLLCWVVRRSVAALVAGVLRRLQRDSGAASSTGVRSRNIAGDVEAARPVEVPLLCPLSCRPITTAPARGSGCAHIACFDLNSYVSHSCHLSCWNCPICNAATPVDDIVVDFPLAEAMAKWRAASATAPKLATHCERSGAWTVVAGASDSSGDDDDEQNSTARESLPTKRTKKAHA